jgi:hypothetical protein
MVILNRNHVRGGDEHDVSRFPIRKHGDAVDKSMPAILGPDMPSSVITQRLPSITGSDSLGVDFAHRYSL